MKNLIKNLPKAELHLHLEGTLEPELLFELAKKNNIELAYKSIEELKKAYEFDSLDSFLDIYYAGSQVLIEKEDFTRLAWEYFLKCKEQNIVHTEIMFDPQAHTKRGIDLANIIMGLVQAQKRAEKELGISSYLIMSFLRDLSQKDALEILENSLEYKEHIVAVGLDSAEMGNPPSKFEKVYKKAKEYGYRLVAHAGEEAGSDYIWEAIKLLHVERIDHGITCEEDEKLVQLLKTKQIPLTVCPLSNVKLQAVSSISEHNVLRLLEKGLLITINSDDPAYFGGYLNKNYEELVEAFGMDKEVLKTLIINSFEASFLSKSQKNEWIKKLQDYKS